MSGWKTQPLHLLPLQPQCRDQDLFRICPGAGVPGQYFVPAQSDRPVYGLLVGQKIPARHSFAQNSGADASDGGRGSTGQPGDCRTTAENRRRPAAVHLRGQRSGIGNAPVAACAAVGCGGRGAGVHELLCPGEQQDKNIPRRLFRLADLVCDSCRNHPERACRDALRSAGKNENTDLRSLPNARSGVFIGQTEEKWPGNRRREILPLFRKKVLGNLRI